MKRNLSRAPWFWGAVHNLIAHPLLVTRARWATAFHNWTAERMDKEPAGQDRLAVVSGQLRPMGGVPPAPAPIDPNFTVVAELRRLQSIGDQANRHLARIVAAVELAAPTRRTLAALWAVAMVTLLGAAFALRQVAERRQAAPSEAIAPAYVHPAPPLVDGRDFELVVLDPVKAKAEGRGLAELWLHHADGTASRAEIRPDGRGTVVHIDAEGAEVKR